MKCTIFGLMGPTTDRMHLHQRPSNCLVYSPDLGLDSHPLNKLGLEKIYNFMNFCLIPLKCMAFVLLQETYTHALLKLFKESIWGSLL